MTTKDLHSKILTLPKSDFPSLKERNGNDNENNNETDNDNDNDNENNGAAVTTSKASTDSATHNPPLLLLSLPTSLKTSDLSSSHFFLSEDDNNGCRLINESKGMTFDLIRVDSSNAYVMLPPQPSTSTSTSESESASTSQPPVAKRMRQTIDDRMNESMVQNSSNHVQGRLLREKNTFFMECTTPKTNLEQEISDYLIEHCTYHSQSSSSTTATSNGMSIFKLSIQFQHSQKEVCDVIKKIHAFPIPKSSSSPSPSPSQKYGILSEEIERDTWNVIVGVLSEWEGGKDYANKGVVLNDMIYIIMSRSKDEGNDDMEEGIVRYCLEKCIIGANDNDNDTKGKHISSDTHSPVKLDAKYIARKIAHQLFNSQIAPWKQSLFLSEWYRLMPGVGKEYEPSIDLLKGIAIGVSVSTVSPVDQADNNRVGGDSYNVGDNDDDDSNMKEAELYWKYFPKEALPSSDGEKFGVMFKEQDKWKLEDLKPYFNNTKFKALLLKYTRRIEDDNDIVDNDDEGPRRVWYIAK